MEHSPFFIQIKQGLKHIISFFLSELSRLESVHEILWCDHSNEISSAVICFLILYFIKWKLGFFFNLEVKELKKIDTLKFPIPDRIFHEQTINSTLIWMPNFLKRHLSFSMWKIARIINSDSVIQKANIMNTCLKNIRISYYIKLLSSFARKDRVFLKFLQYWWL